MELDLFASLMNCQLEKYASWFPDPFAIATDAFQMSWSNLKGLQFSTFFNNLLMPGKSAEGSRYNGINYTGSSFFDTKRFA